MFVKASITMFCVTFTKMYQSICILFVLFLSVFFFKKKKMVLAVDAPSTKAAKDCDKSVSEH